MFICFWHAYNEIETSIKRIDCKFIINMPNKCPTQQNDWLYGQWAAVYANSIHKQRCKKEHKYRYLSTRSVSHDRAAYTKYSVCKYKRCNEQGSGIIILHETKMLLLYSLENTTQSHHHHKQCMRLRNISLLYIFLF